MKSFDIGRISAVYPERGTVRVFFEENNKVSEEFIVLNRSIYAAEDNHLPRIGNRVGCAFMQNSSEGFVLGVYELI